MALAQTMQCATGNKQASKQASIGAVIAKRTECPPITSGQGADVDREGEQSMGKEKGEGEGEDACSVRM